MSGSGGVPEHPQVANARDLKGSQHEICNDSLYVSLDTVPNRSHDAPARRCRDSRVLWSSIERFVRPACKGHHRYAALCSWEEGEENHHPPCASLAPCLRQRPRSRPVSRFSQKPFPLPELQHSYLPRSELQHSYLPRSGWGLPVHVTITIQCP